MAHRRPSDWHIGNFEWGVERSTVCIAGAPYLRRWIIYFSGCTLRLHKFYRGDDDRAPHDHPWWFVTIPLRGYWESVVRGSVQMVEWVCPFWPHFRSAQYKHIVLGTHFDGVWSTPTPVYTIVITGRKEQSWGFWPGLHTFVPWREWK